VIEALTGAPVVHRLEIERTGIPVTDADADADVDSDVDVVGDADGDADGNIDADSANERDSGVDSDVAGDSGCSCGAATLGRSRASGLLGIMFI
jgi:hypothetical protein